KLAQFFRAHFLDSAVLLPVPKRVPDHLACGGILAGVNGFLQQIHELRCEGNADLLNVRHGKELLAPMVANSSAEVSIKFVRGPAYPTGPPPAHAAGVVHGRRGSASARCRRSATGR